MKYKILATTLASIMLATSASLVNTSNTSAATHSVYSSYWNKTRTVTVTKTTKFHRFDALKRRYTGKSKTLHTGRKIRVRAAGEFIGWVLPAKAGSRYYWISTKHTSNWMKEYKPEYTTGFKGNTYRMEDGSTIKITGIRNVKEVNYDDSVNHEIIVLAQFSSNWKSMTPQKAFKSNLHIFPTGTDEDTHALKDNTNHSDLLEFPDDLDGTYEQSLDNSTDYVDKDYYENFALAFTTSDLSDDDKDLQASSYTISDDNGSKITLPVKNVTVKVDDE